MNLSHNERVKLTAAFLNNLAVAIIGTGLVAPFFAILYGLSNLDSGQIRLFAVAGPVWLLIGAGLHMIARGVLGAVRE